MIGALRRKKADADALTVNGRAVRIDPTRLIGNGGEAEVYDLGGNIALKRFKRPEHVDYAHSPAAQRAADDRLVVHQTKLPALMELSLPPRVVAPLAVANDGAGRIAGYTMPLIANAQVLLQMARPSAGAQPSFSQARRGQILCDLHATVAALHRQGVIIGDFNDLNVLVAGHSAHLIDIDSAQFGPFASTLFTARFLDPRLTDGITLQPVRPYDRDSDWYAFAVMAFQLLLFVDPYGGIYRPPNSKEHLPHDARPLRRISVFHRDVRYPKHAIPYDVLLPDLVAHFRAVFEDDRRGEFPLQFLLRASGVLAPPAPRPAVMVRGRVIAEDVPALPTTTAPQRFWIDGGTLYRDGSFGREVVGSVLGGLTRLWTGPAFGFGFYRASEMTVAFVFDTHARGIRDDVKLPRIGGQIIDAAAAFTKERCWFFLSTQEEGRIRHRCTVLLRDGTVEATLEVEPAEGHWLGRLHGNAAAGDFLLVATDDGIVRVEPRGGTLSVAATFPDTEGLVDSATSLLAAPDGLYAVDHGRIRRLKIS